jgi:hypothetical protein
MCGIVYRKTGSVLAGPLPPAKHCCKHLFSPRLKCRRRIFVMKIYATAAREQPQQNLFILIICKVYFLVLCTRVLGAIHIYFSEPQPGWCRDTRCKNKEKA